MPNLTQLNSPLKLELSKDPYGAPKELQNYLEELYASLYQIQLGFVQYCGIAAQDVTAWEQLRPQDSILQQNMNRLYLEATEPIPEGAIVNVFLSGSDLKARLANATNNTKPGWAYCNTSGGIASGGSGEFILMQGLCTSIPGLLPGTHYYLSTVSGLLTTVAPGAAGTITQFLGLALDTNIFYFNSGTWIQN